MIMKRFFTLILCFGIFLSVYGTQFAYAADLESVNPKSYQELIASHKGKIVLVNFFATWCPPCREEIPGLVKVAENMANDVVVIGLSVDEDPRKLPDFVKSMKINYPLYLAELSLAQAFKVQTIPHNLVYDKNGKLVANTSGLVTEEELEQFIKVLLEDEANAKSDNS